MKIDEATLNPTPVERAAQFIAQLAMRVVKEGMLRDERSSLATADRLPSKGQCELSMASNSTDVERRKPHERGASK